jgi:uncharacterized spore protein YtfJ
MEINVEELLSKITDHIKTLATTNTVVGEEFQLGEFTCKPVIKIGTGFGSGAGSGDNPKNKGKGEGGGAGAALGIMPLGFLVSRGDEISFIAVDKKSGLTTLFEKVPDLIDKMMAMKEKKDKKEEKEK